MIYILRRCWFLLLGIALYFAMGFYNNNFYRASIEERERITRDQDTGLHVAIVQVKEISTGFTTGIELAAEDINKKTPGRLTLHEVRSAGDAKTVSALNSMLRHDLRISAVVAEAPAKLADQIAVVCESYGVALILLNADPPFLTARGFKYVVKMEPSYQEYCQTVIEHLALVCDKPEQAEIRIGVFFDQSAIGNDTLVNTFLGEGRAHNELYHSARSIQRALDEGVLAADQTLASLRGTFYLQAGVSIDGSMLSSYLKHKSLSGDPDLTIQQALDRVPKLQNQLKFNFAQSFDSERLDPAYLVEVTKSAPLDCIVLITRLPEASQLIGYLRSLKVTAPIICVDYQPAEWVDTTLGSLAQNLYLVTNVDPDRSTVEFDEFRRRFSQRATDAGRVVKEASQAGVLAYESLAILSNLVDEQGTMAPIDLMTMLGIDGSRWSGLSSDKIGFDRSGDGIGRKLVLVTLKDHAYVALKGKEQ